MKSLSDVASRVTKNQFSRKYIALGRVVSCWADIVGQELADKAQPVKIQYRRKKTKKEKPSATLDIACASADATMLHYQKGLLLERMNTLFGDRWITDIRFVPVERMTKAPVRGMRRKRVLAAADHAFLEETLGQIEDEQVKQRLESLGQNILREEERVL